MSTVVQKVLDTSQYLWCPNLPKCAQKVSIGQLSINSQTPWNNLIISGVKSCLDKLKQSVHRYSDMTRQFRTFLEPLAAKGV